MGTVDAVLDRLEIIGAGTGIAAEKGAEASLRPLYPNVVGCTVENCRGAAVRATGDAAVSIDGLTIINTPEGLVAEGDSAIRARNVWHD